MPILAPFCCTKDPHEWVYKWVISKILHEGLVHYSTRLEEYWLFDIIGQVDVSIMYHYSEMGPQTDTVMCLSHGWKMWFTLETLEVYWNFKHMWLAIDERPTRWGVNYTQLLCLWSNEVVYLVPWVSIPVEFDMWQVYVYPLIGCSELSLIE